MYRSVRVGRVSFIVSCYTHDNVNICVPAHAPTQLPPHVPTHSHTTLPNALSPIAGTAFFTGSQLSPLGVSHDRYPRSRPALGRMEGSGRHGTPWTPGPPAPFGDRGRIPGDGAGVPSGTPRLQYVLSYAAIDSVRSPGGTPGSSSYCVADCRHVSRTSSSPWLCRICV